MSSPLGLDMSSLLIKKSEVVSRVEGAQLSSPSTLEYFLEYNPSSQFAWVDNDCPSRVIHTSIPVSCDVTDCVDTSVFATLDFATLCKLLDVRGAWHLTQSFVRSVLLDVNTLTSLTLECQHLIFFPNSPSPTAGATYCVPPRPPTNPTRGALSDIVSDVSAEASSGLCGARDLHHLSRDWEILKRAFGETRTRTKQVLSLPPLPLGYECMIWCPSFRAVRRAQLRI